MDECTCGCVVWQIGSETDVPDPGYPRTIHLPGMIHRHQLDKGQVFADLRIVTITYGCETGGLIRREVGRRQRIARARYDQSRSSFFLPTFGTITVFGIRLRYLSGFAWTPWGPWRRREKNPISDQQILGSLEPCKPALC